MKSSKKQQRKYLEECKVELVKAKENGDERRIAIAQAYLGYGFVQSKKVNEGLKEFDEAFGIAEQSNDYRLKAKVLGIKVLAFQIVGRLPDAYKAAEEIEKIADEQEDFGLKCEALLNQGQIQQDSGDPILANEKYERAHAVAKSIDDKHYLMNVLGALGNYNLTLVAYDKAYENFLEAREIAKEIENKNAEIGYLGNIGMIFEWKKEHKEANEVFTEVLEHFQEGGNIEAELSVLSRLVTINIELNNTESVEKHCQKGLELSKEDPQTTLFFLENLVKIYIITESPDKAHETLKNAIEITRAKKLKENELSYLNTLGESYLRYENNDEALGAYEQALELTQRLQKLTDRAYLLGRIGIVYAEKGEVEKAIKYHEDAIKDAREQNLKVLEAEQLTMLGMAFNDLEKTSEAKKQYELALAIYQEEKMTEEEEKLKILIAG